MLPLRAPVWVGSPTDRVPSGRHKEILMTSSRQMLKATPSKIGYPQDVLAQCIDACFSCAQSCAACADACLGEEMVADLRRCIVIDLNCADICASTGNVLSRQTMFTAAMSIAALEACRTACRLCADECEQHADMHEHCRICADACRQCESACDLLLNAR